MPGLWTLYSASQAALMLASVSMIHTNVLSPGGPARDTDHQECNINTTFSKVTLQKSKQDGIVLRSPVSGRGPSELWHHDSGPS